MRTKLVVVTGVAPLAMDSTLMTLAWDLPHAVSVRHRIDPHSQVLTRTVSDVTGVLEEVHVQLEHACVSCALREDILPTLERLARDARWTSIVAGLPVGTEEGSARGCWRPTSARRRMRPAAGSSSCPTSTAGRSASTRATAIKRWGDCRASRRPESRNASSGSPGPGRNGTEPGPLRARFGQTRLVVGQVRAT